MTYKYLILPESWKLIINALKERPESFDELVKLGIERKKLKEILYAMLKLNMIKETKGLRYTLTRRGSND